METILKIFHTFIQCFIIGCCFISIDMPCKIISWILLLLIGFVLTLIFPIAKNMEVPNWFVSWVDYTTSINKSIALKIGELWDF